MSNAEIEHFLIERIINKIVSAEMLVDTKISINPLGKFDIGGPAANQDLQEE